jgi:hypothetical protein
MRQSNLSNPLNYWPSKFMCTYTHPPFSVIRNQHKPLSLNLQFWDTNKFDYKTVACMGNINMGDLDFLSHKLHTMWSFKFKVRSKTETSRVRDRFISYSKYSRRGTLFIQKKVGSALTETENWDLLVDCTSRSSGRRQGKINLKAF